MTAGRPRVLLTDYPWADVAIEQRLLGEAGVELVTAADGSEASLIAAARGADGRGIDAILTCWAKVTERVLDAAPRCQIVSRMGIGLDNIDLAACTARGIPVTNVPDYCLTEVAEHAIALLFALGRKVAFYHHETKQGRYVLRSGAALRRMAGQTLGIVGLGNIGRQVAIRAQALGLQVIAARRPYASSSSSGFANADASPAPPSDAAGLAVRRCDWNKLLETSDYVSLHVPLTPETRHMLGAAEFARMRPTAYLINTARGGLIDHAALARALDAEQLAGAALDVQDPEPPDLSKPPYGDPRVIVTPHAAFVSVESLIELRRRACGQVLERLAGRWPPHVVNLASNGAPASHIAPDS